MPDFTVIVPLHNKAQTIARTLRSIAEQDLPVREIIVVDDCSTDGSAEIVADLGMPNVRVLRRDTPGPGGYPARNLGVENAQTEWVGFLDADDEWLPIHTAKAAEIIRAHPEVNTIFFGREITKRGGTRRITAPEAKIYTFSELARIFGAQNIFHINSMVIRRTSFLATGGFRTDRGWRRGGDSELFLRLIREAGPVFVSPEITTLYDMNFSDVVNNAKNYATEHPVHRTIDAWVRAGDLPPGVAADLKRMANRKVMEWIREMPKGMLGTKLGLMRRMYPGVMKAGEMARIGKSLLRG